MDHSLDSDPRQSCRVPPPSYPPRFADTPTPPERFLQTRGASAAYTMRYAINHTRCVIYGGRQWCNQRRSFRRDIICDEIGGNNINNAAGTRRGARRVPSPRRLEDVSAVSRIASRCSRLSRQRFSNFAPFLVSTAYAWWENRTTARVTDEL